MIKVNNFDITSLYYSGYTIVRAYGCEGELVYSSYPVPYGTRYILYLNDDTTVTGSCTVHGQPYHQIDGNWVHSEDTDRFNTNDDLSAVTSVALGECATALNNGAFSGFTNMSAITVSNNLVDIGQGAFTNCYLLQNFPYSTNLEHIYDSAFYKCYSLTSVTIPSSVVSIGDGAFRACSGLTSVTMEATTPPTLGRFVFYNEYGDVKLPLKIYVPAESVNAYKTATNWSDYADRIYPIGYVPYDEKYFTIVAEDNITVNFTQSPISASTDNGTTWASLSNLSLNAGDKMILRGLEASNVVNGEHGMGAIEVSGGGYYVEGNILSLYYGDDFYNAGQSGGTIPQSAFKYLFWGQSGLTSAENLVLPSITVPIDGYFEMFINCSSMTAAPEIPATNLSGWSCQRMFQGCTSLIKAPSVLYANYVSEESYLEMFKGCTSLTTAPEIMATEVGKKGCQGMFYQCSNLTNVPDLSVTTFYDWQGCWYMFEDCTSLTTAPALPAATLGSDCYDSIFKGCTSLNYIKCLATDISATNCTGNWVSGVASSGTFVKAASMSSWTTGVNGIPTGWTVQNAD